MLDTITKRRIDTARDILVGKVPDPKSQVEQITIALIYKFMDDMDAESEELGGKRKFFTGDFARYGWAKLMAPSLGGHEMLAHYAEGIAKMTENPGLPALFRDIFKNAYLPYRDPETLRAFLKIIDAFTSALNGAPGDLLSPDDKGRLAKNIRGYDISPDMVRLSLVNLYLHGFADPHIFEYDSLTSEERWNECADVILAKVTPCFENGKAGYAKGLTNKIGFGSSEFYVLRPSQRILAEYLYFMVTNSSFRSAAVANMTGTGGLQRVPRKYVEDFPIPLPPLEIQLEIVAEIEGYQEKITN